MSLVLLLLAWFLGSGAEASERLHNPLRPFTTDGCSTFPNGVPYFASKLWLRCCVLHDVAYWRGGTREDRVRADDELHACVKESSGSASLANLIWLGVRAGGHPGLPTSSGWGKGWTLPRGYAPFTPEEKAQVDALRPEIPDDVTGMDLESRPLVRPRFTFSGDRCLDLAVVQIQLALGRGFEVDAKREEKSEGAEGWAYRLELKPKGCAEPFHFEFLLLRASACTDATNELVARGRIRLRSWGGPAACAD